MKTTNIIQRLSLFLLALVLTMPTWAQGTEVVSISSAADWKTFCQRVNDNGEPFLNAKLTQDVDLGGEIVMLGSVSYPYSGTFDGNGHTLSFNWNAGEDNQIAPFYYVENATIKNLRTQGKITSKGNSLSGMVRAALGTTTITGCISDVDITGGNGDWDDSKAAGMVQAVASGASVHITDCLVKGSITDNADEYYRAMAGFVFYNGGTYTLTRCLYAGTNNADNSNNNCYTFAPTNTSGATTTLNNCYYLNPCGKAQGEQVTAEQLKNGYVAHKLQGTREETVWGQVLGTDTIPQPTAEVAKQVYEVKFTLNNEVKATRYANYDGNVGTLPTPQEILGVAYNTANTYKLVFADGFYAEYPIYADRTVAVDVIVNNMCEIATKEDWKKFGDLVKSGERNLNARLTVDLNLGTDIQKIGSESTSYSGTFDGQGHTITIDWNGYGGSYFALFSFVTDATIKNLRVTGQMTSDSEPLGVFALNADGNTTFSGCVSDVKITNGNTNSSYCAAGMVLSAYSKGKITFKDCIVSGDLNGTTDNSRQGMGGFVCGQADDATCTFDNCLYTGTNNAKGGYAFAPKPTLNNCYYVNAFANVQGTPTTAEQLASGYVAWMLQSGRAENVWGQTLGTDDEPMLTTEKAKRVYKVDFKYMDEVKATRYANSGGRVKLPTAKELLGAGYNPKLTYALNFGNFTATTPVTADKTVDVGVDVSGTFPIATKDDWKEFCGVVNNGVTAVDAKLTADVNLGTEVVWVGDNYNQYGGTFDGQGHTLSFDWTSQGDPAPFDFVDGATIKNLRTKGKITTSGGEASGLLGNAYGATTISNCVSDVEITSSIDWDACKAAGLVQTVGYNGKVTVTDCVVKGNINATTEKGRKGMAGFVYTLDDGGACTLTNCLYLGKNNGVGDECFTFAPAGVTLNNCYYLNACGKAQGDKITEAQLESGEVAHLLQGTRTENVWGQTLGTDATPQPTAEAAKRVYKVEFTYDNKVAAVRYANTGGHVKLPTAKELLGADYDAQKSYTLTFENGFSETTAINGDITVSVTVNVVTGIDGVTDDNSTVRGAVYNLQGVRVAESSDAETLRRLPAGVYIVKGKKFVVR